MPSLVRFLVILAILAGLGFCAMLALATFVQVTPRTIEEPVAPARLK